MGAIVSQLSVNIVFTGLTYGKCHGLDLGEIPAELFVYSER